MRNIFKHFLTKKVHKCKKNAKIRKGNITSKNEKSKKPSKFNSILSTYKER
jgi:hypothetical protein